MPNRKRQSLLLLFTLLCHQLLVLEASSQVGTLLALPLLLIDAFDSEVEHEGVVNRRFSFSIGRCTVWLIVEGAI